MQFTFLGDDEFNESHFLEDYDLHEGDRLVFDSNFYHVSRILPTENGVVVHLQRIC